MGIREQHAIQYNKHDSQKISVLQDLKSNCDRRPMRRSCHLGDASEEKRAISDGDVWQLGSSNDYLQCLTLYQSFKPRAVNSVGFRDSCD